jgi:hypothetical protein
LSAGAEAVTATPSRTITGWLARGGPKKPEPARILRPGDPMTPEEIDQRNRIQAQMPGRPEDR